MMVKGVYILKSHLDAIVSLLGSAGFPDEKATTVSWMAEQVSDQTPHNARGNKTVGKRLRMDGRMAWGLFTDKMPPVNELLYDEVKTTKFHGFTTDMAGTGSRDAQINNRIIVNVPPTKDRKLQKAVWKTLRNVDIPKKDTLHVRAKDGIVTLSGVLETSTQKDAAGRAAQSVSGVKRVINAIHMRTLPVQREQD
ncbi:MAG: BON domain-containing protein [Nitrospirales bacterium]|nr:BON domain-containing protein [Nitrospirales bacterium]